MRSGILIALSAFLVPGLPGCTTSIDAQVGSYRRGEMEQARDGFTQLLSDGEYDPHLARLERGMARLALGDAQGAVEDFTAAIDTMEGLRGGSLPQEALALIVDDMVRDYPGAPYEQVFARLALGLSFLTMGDRFEDVSAACRDLDGKMEQIEAHFGRSYPLDGDGNATEFSFQIPPLGKYFAALAAERRGELDSAGIYMSQATNAMPECRFFESEDQRMRRGETDNLVFVIALLGSVPKKVEGTSEELTLLIKGIKALHSLATEEDDPEDFAAAALTAPVRIPVHVEPRPFWHGGFTVRANGQEISTERVADLDAYARREYDELKTGILIRAAVRRIIKESLGRAASHKTTDDDEGRNLLEIGLSHLTAAIERIDTRMWRTLPRECHAARLTLPLETTEIVLVPRTPAGGAPITVALDRSRGGPAFVLVIHPGRNASPIVIVDEAHRPAPVKETT